MRKASAIAELLISLKKEIFSDQMITKLIPQVSFCFTLHNSVRCVRKDMPLPQFVQQLCQLHCADPTIHDYIENGPYEPVRIIAAVPATATTEVVPERYVVKEIRHWSDEDKKKVGIDARAKTIISMALPDEVFHSIMHLKTSKEMWETICVQYEGTTEIQETRKINLVRQYESFIAGKGLIAEEHDWAESEESSSGEEEVANLCLMAEIKEEVEEASETSMSYISSQVSISTNPSLPEAERSRAVDVLTIDLYNALNDKTQAENKNVHLTQELDKCHEKIRELTLLEEKLKDQATKKAKLKVPSKPSVNQSSRSVIEIFDLCPPKLKIDLKPTRSEEIKIPPISHEKSILGPGPAHLKLAKPSSSGPKTIFKYRKCYHCGFSDHIASKFPTATKADKTTKVKMNASKAEKVTKAEKSTKVKNTTKVKKLTKVKITTEAESSSAVKIIEPSISTNPKGPIEKWVPSNA
ncbi:hypothetical protein L6452_08947 [Arctium lappa]|uniref:Uncharacterized protein n=1 Tax=Arctium lappa TaxID=4217 RepID=A0ACB9DIM0_ARCLA|nr:hypothetical protein L6452_08947 [Arctium lappa]